ncbi:MAG: hypothetical protein QHH43_00535 [Candidatus Saccharicenans sp.]|jgi:hypothetical protein|nr:hypothetical protein [Candidatus Saccharicenans sp.]MDH7574230.1 hypothetical protein [Candidatus Saccharicenans sp.]
MVYSQGKIKMKLCFAGIALLLLIAIRLPAQEWRDLLVRDAVAIKGGKMVYEEVGLVKIEVPDHESAQFQLKLKSEAPATGVISRDNFVAITTQVFISTLIMAIAEAYEVPVSTFINGFDYKELSTPIGTPDLEINLIMTRDGIQIELVNTESNQRSRFTETWDNFFKK